MRTSGLAKTGIPRLFKASVDGVVVAFDGDENRSVRFQVSQADIPTGK
jgi:hypothetical protein